MARRKTTWALDADLLRALKVAAAREDKAEYQIVEDALREHLGLGPIERIWTRLGEGLDEEEALALARKELTAARKNRRKTRSHA